MKKLNSSEIDKVAGGQCLEIKQNGDHYDVLLTVKSFKNRPEAEAWADDNIRRGTVAGLFSEQMREEYDKHKI